MELEREEEWRNDGMTFLCVWWEKEFFVIHACVVGKSVGICQTHFVDSIDRCDGWRSDDADCSAPLGPSVARSPRRRRFTEGSNCPAAMPNSRFELWHVSGRSPMISVNGWKKLIPRVDKNVAWRAFIIDKVNVKFLPATCFFSWLIFSSKRGFWLTVSLSYGYVCTYVHTDDGILDDSCQSFLKRSRCIFAMMFHICFIPF